MKITSPAFSPGGPIPAKYACEGVDINPPLQIFDVPAEAKSLALICEDPDAPVGVFTHWVMWNINPQTTEIGEGQAPAEASQGINDFGQAGYGGPCPPAGTHRYFFKLFALDDLLDLSGKTTKTDLEKAMAGHILAQAELVGTYQKGGCNV